MTSLKNRPGQLPTLLIENDENLLRDKKFKYDEETLQRLEKEKHSYIVYHNERDDKADKLFLQNYI